MRLLMTVLGFSFGIAGLISDVAADHIRSDGRGGFYTSEGHIRSDGRGGFYTSDGHIRSDGRGGFYTP